MRDYEFTHMEHSFTTTKQSGVGLDRKAMEKQGFQKAGYNSYMEVVGFNYLISRSNITIIHTIFENNQSLVQQLKYGLAFLLDKGIIKDYDFHQGKISLTHSMVVDIPTTEPVMDIAGCREADGDKTRFSVVYKFKVGNNHKLIGHEMPASHIAKSLASLHKINLLSKGANLEIKTIFNLNNSSSKGNNKFIKNNLHYRIISDIIDNSLNNLLGNEDD